MPRARRRRGSTGGRRWRRRSRSRGSGRSPASRWYRAPGRSVRRARRGCRGCASTGSCRRAGVCEDRDMAEPSPRPSRDQIREAPKVLLHDHLDGGLRPATVLELADQVGHDLPADDADTLGRWFAESADSGSLVRYLETFDHTVAVMQTEAAIERVARECVADLAADGVVYAEVRYAPEQHVGSGLDLDEVVDAVRSGFEAGMGDARGGGAGRPPLPPHPPPAR